MGNIVILSCQVVVPLVLAAISNNASSTDLPAVSMISIDCWPG